MSPLLGINTKTKDRPSLFQKKVERRFVRGKRSEKKNEEDIQNRELIRWVRVLIVLWLCFLSAAGYQYFFSGVVSLQTIRVTGTGILLPGEIEQVVRTSVAGKYGKLVDRDNLVVLSTTQLEQSLVAAFPLIRRVEVKKVFPNRLEVSLLERGDLLFWCFREQQCFLLDEHGFVLNQPAALEEHRVMQLFLVDESGKEVASGDQVATEGFLRFIRSLPQAFSEQSGISLRNTVFLPSKYADEVRVETESGLELLIRSDIPIEKTLNVLRIVREKAVPRDKVGDLVSVDLRVAGKAFYRLRNEESQETTLPLEAGVSPEKQ